MFVHVEYFSFILVYLTKITSPFSFDITIVEIYKCLLYTICLSIY